jgi:hypothetical protein
MSKRNGLDGRQRDEDGEIRHKNGNTKIGTLRRTYGEDFASGHRSDMKLENLLKQEKVETLSELLKKGGEK